MICHRKWWLCRRMWWLADNLSGFEIFFRNLRTISVIHIEMITGVILTLKVTVDFLSFLEMRRKTSKVHLFVQIYNFFIFSLITRKHILNRQIGSRKSLIQVIKDALSAYLRTYHTPTLELKLVLKQT